jgi:hypothetical protein
MNEDQRESTYNHTIREWIALIPGDLPNDAISLWHISVAAEQRFNLAGQDLAEFIKRGVEALLNAGAIPVVGIRDREYDWVALHRFGSDKEHIVPAVMQEWERSSKDENYLFSVWFALPSKYVRPSQRL